MVKSALFSNYLVDTPFVKSSFEEMISHFVVSDFTMLSWQIVHIESVFGLTEINFSKKNFHIYKCLRRQNVGVSIDR